MHIALGLAHLVRGSGWMIVLERDMEDRGSGVVVLAHGGGFLAPLKMVSMWTSVGGSRRVPSDWWWVGSLVGQN